MDLQTELQATVERLRDECGRSMEDAHGYLGAATSHDPAAAGGVKPGDEFHCMPPQNLLSKLLASDLSVPQKVRAGTPSTSIHC